MNNNKFNIPFITLPIFGIVVFLIGCSSNIDIENTEEDTPDSSFYLLDTNSIQEEYCKMTENLNKLESFLFFTDPHLTDYDRYQDVTEAVRNGYISTVLKVYNSLPLDYCICGGDWLNTNHTVSEACGFLGYWDAYMRKHFHNYLPVFGNHDFNPYWGIYGKGISYNPDFLSHITVNNLSFRENKGSWYSYDGLQTKFYVLDTGLSFPEYNNSMSVEESNPYAGFINNRWPQVAWLADKLLTDDAEHSIIFSHIYSLGLLGPEPTWNNQANIQTFAKTIRELCVAYNKRQSISLNGTTYVFNKCTGRVEINIVGHAHFDYVDTEMEVPIFVVTDLKGGYYDGNGQRLHALIPTFDCCLADYDNKKLKALRVGAGVSRIVNFENSTVSIGDSITIETELHGKITWENRDITKVSLSASNTKAILTGVSAGVVGIVAADSNGKEEYFTIVVS